MKIIYHPLYFLKDSFLWNDFFPNDVEKHELEFSCFLFSQRLRCADYYLSSWDFHSQITISMQNILILIITYYLITTVIIKITDQNIVIWEISCYSFNSNWRSSPTVYFGIGYQPNIGQNEKKTFLLYKEWRGFLWIISI